MSLASRFGVAIDYFGGVQDDARLDLDVLATWQINERWSLRLSGYYEPRPSPAGGGFYIDSLGVAGRLSYSLDESLEASPDIAPQLASHAVSLLRDEPDAIRAILHRVLVINEGRQTREIAVASVGKLTGSGKGAKKYVAEAVSAVVEACPDQSDDVLAALADPVPPSLQPVVSAAVQQGLHRASIASAVLPGPALRGIARASNMSGRVISPPGPPFDPPGPPFDPPGPPFDPPGPPSQWWPSQRWPPLIGPPFRRAFYRLIGSLWQCHARVLP